MPVYDYACRKCGRKFAVTMTLAEYGRKRVRCPKCGSLSVGRRIASFFAQTSKKS